MQEGKRQGIDFRVLLQNQGPTIILALLGIWVLLRTAWVCDDAFISFCSAANLVEGKGFTFQIYERVQAFSNPLWTILMAFAYLFTGEVWRTGMILGISISVLALVLLQYKSDAEWHKRIMIGFLALLSSAFIDYGTSGLENPLSNLLSLAFAIQFLERRTDVKWFRNLVLLASLLMLNRPDFIFFVLPACIFAFRKTDRIGKWRALLLGLLPILIWEAFALFYFGFLLPNTWYAKLGTGDAAGFLVGKGLLYLKVSLVKDPITGFVLLFGILSIFIVENKKHRMLIFGVLLYLAAVVQAGGDFMQGRMLTVPFAICLFLLLRTPMHKAWILPAAGLVLLGIIRNDSPLRSNADYHIGRTENPMVLYPEGITDERAMYWKKTGWFSNHGLETHPMIELERKADKNRAIESVHALPKEVKVVGAIGMRGYEAEPNVFLLDELALSDPLLARFPAMQLRWWRAGHRPHLIPEGYEAHLLNPSMHLKDAELDRYLQKLDIVTKLPIWNAERVRTIFGFLFGRYSGYFMPERYQYNHVDLKVEGDSMVWESPIIVTQWRPIQIYFDQDKFKRNLKVVAAGTKEMWCSAEWSFLNLDMNYMRREGEENGFTTFLFEFPESTAEYGFNLLYLQGEKYTRDIQIKSIEVY